MACPLSPFQSETEERRDNCDRVDVTEAEAEAGSVGHCCYYHLGDDVSFVYMIYADVSSDKRPPGGRQLPTNLIHHQVIVTLICIAALRGRRESQLRSLCVDYT